MKNTTSEYIAPEMKIYFLVEESVILASSMEDFEETEGEW